jgi:hypothetical protein
MIPTTYTVIAQKGQNFFEVELEGRNCFGPNEQLQAETFARQLYLGSRSDEVPEDKKIDRAFVMKHAVVRVYGTAPVHPEDKKEAGGGP